MVGVYLTVDDVQNYLNIIFTTDSTPNISQVEKFITLAETDFERDVGKYSSTEDNVEIVECLRNGFFLSQKPIVAITKIEESNGDKITPTWSEIANTDYVIKNIDTGHVLIRYPSLFKQYQITYDAGYEYENIPENIKYLVFLMTMRYMFNQYLFESNGSGENTEIIDNDVYKLITRSSPYNGLNALDRMIDDAKSRFKGKLKTYIKH